MLKMTERIKNYVIVLTIVLIGALYLKTIKPGAPWGEDSFMYIRHAMNIVNGVKYDKLGLILNPNAMINPSALPPVFPLLLAPVYKVFGIDIHAMKAEMCLIFLVFLSLLVPLVRRRISFASLLGLLVIFSLHPSILKFKDAILSDIPFLLFTYWALLLIHQFYESEHFRSSFFPAVYLGVVMYLSYGTRSAGVILLPSLLAYEFIRWRRISARTLITMGVFSFLAVIQWIFFHNEGDYVKILIHNDVAFAVRDNLQCFLSFWDGYYHPKIQIVLFLSLIFFGLSGFITQVRRRLSVTEIFFILYWASIFTWPAAFGFRYFLPIIPLLIFYMLCGVEFWGSKPVGAMWSVLRTVIFVGFLGALVFSYGSRYHDWDYRTFSDGPYQRGSQELFQFIREKTPRDAVLIFIKPGVMAFFTDRRVSTYHCPANQEDLWQYMRGIGAGYLIECHFQMQSKEEKQYLSSFIERYQKQLKVVFNNKEFRVLETIQ